jgi:hypothetical protein
MDGAARAGRDGAGDDGVLAALTLCRAAPPRRSRSPGRSIAGRLAVRSERGDRP